MNSTNRQILFTRRRDNNVILSKRIRKQGFVMFDHQDHMLRGENEGKQLVRLVTVSGGE